MEHAKQVALIHRLLDHLEQRTSDQGSPSGQSVTAYTDPARFVREQAMLARTPVAVGHASELPEAGDFITHDAGQPLLLVRQDDGSIKGLLNVCRHRGTRVEREARGHRQRFTCPYHAWSYRRDGQLAGVPHRKGFAQVDPQTHSLRMFVDNLYLVDPHPPHMRNVFPKKTLTSLAGQEETTWRLREHSNVLYPNTIVLVQSDHCAVLHLWPQAVDRTLVQAYGVVPGPVHSDKARRHWDANTQFLDGVTAEDFALGATIQANLSSGANEVLTFGAFEHALTLFHGQVERDLARD